MQALRCVLKARCRVATESAFEQRGAETVALGRCHRRAATLLPTERKTGALGALLDRPADLNLPARGGQCTMLGRIGGQFVDNEGKTLRCAGDQFYLWPFDRGPGNEARQLTVDHGL